MDASSRKHGPVHGHAVGLGTDYGDANVVFRSASIAHGRIMIMQRLLDESPPNKVRAPHTDARISEFDTLTTERNNCAHGF
jgi:hypothetical protein